MFYLAHSYHTITIIFERNIDSNTSFTANELKSFYFRGRYASDGQKQMNLGFEILSLQSREL
jgi:hypothetical protein